MRIRIATFIWIKENTSKVCCTVRADDMEHWLTTQCNVTQPSMFYTQRQINLYAPYKRATLLKLSKRKYYCDPCADDLLKKHNA